MSKRYDSIKLLSEILGCTIKTIYNKLNEITPFTLNEVYIVAESLNISVTEAIDYLENLKGGKENGLQENN